MTFSIFGLFSQLFFESTNLVSLSETTIVNSFDSMSPYSNPDYLTGLLKSLLMPNAYLKIVFTSFLGVFLIKFINLFTSFEDFVSNYYAIDEQLFEGGSAEKETIELGNNNYFPEFDKNLIDKSSNDSITFFMKFPKDYNRNDLKDKKVKSFNSSIKLSIVKLSFLFISIFRVLILYELSLTAPFEGLIVSTSLIKLMLLLYKLNLLLVI